MIVMFKGKRILVVEDTDSNFSLVKYSLLATRVSIVRATNGEEAIRSFMHDGVFDLILMDIRLPGMNGFEVTRRIREMNKSIPIIAHTALAFELDKEEYLKAGCNAQITKPTDRQTLLKVISEFLITSDKGTDRRNNNH